MERIQLGISLAGAVTSGAYTAGVIDYLFEALENWQLAYDGKIAGIDKTSVPKPYVELSVIGGASAGGMCSVMSLLQLMGKKNILKDSWTKLADTVDQTTLEKALSTDDLADMGRIDSALCSKFIDEITENAFKLEGNLEDAIANIPEFVAKDLIIILTHTLIDGIPLSFDLNDRNDGKNKIDYVTYDTNFRSYYSLNSKRNLSVLGGINPFQDFDPFNTKNLENLKRMTKATGAFPIGLSPRLLGVKNIGVDKIKDSHKLTLLLEANMIASKGLDTIKWDTIFNNLTDDYETLTVDGGATNNAPIGQISDLLKMQSSNPRLLLQVDPYPDRFKEHKIKHDLFHQPAAIINSLWSGGKAKRNDVLDQFDKNTIIGEIFPVKRINDCLEPYPLNTSILEGFGGLFHSDFRNHDYYLGRENAKNFLRYIWRFPISSDLDNSETKDYTFYRKAWSTINYQPFTSKEGSNLPIIPDIHYALEGKNGRNDFNSKLPRTKIHVDEILKYEKQIKKRIRYLVDHGYYKENNGSTLVEKSVNVNKEIDHLIKSKFDRKSMVGRFLMNAVYILVRKKIVNSLTDRALKKILEEMNDQGLLKL